MPTASLKRTIGLPLLTLYGLGTILGAGIYVLVGEVAGVAGMAAPSSFVLACVVAGLTAVSYAELSSRLPKSAGEAAYVEHAFGKRILSQVMGFAVVITGIVSAATLTRGLVGYAGVFLELPASLVITTTLLMLFALASWGISEALWAAAIVTLIEIGGLVFVCMTAANEFPRLSAELGSMLPSLTRIELAGFASGAFLAFYAFIGFEDIVNVAEEVKSPRRTVPLAIVLSLTVATILYFMVAAAAVLSLPPELLAATEAPLAAIIVSHGFPAETISGIGILAVINGALIQLIMASRVLYGMANQGLAWAKLGSLHAKTRTPVLATGIAASCILCLALFFSLSGLARVTSALALLIFATVNAALLRLKRSPEIPEFHVPALIPKLAILTCIAMLVQQTFTML